MAGNTPPRPHCSSCGSNLAKLTGPSATAWVRTHARNAHARAPEPKAEAPKAGTLQAAHRYQHRPGRRTNNSDAEGRREIKTNRQTKQPHGCKQQTDDGCKQPSDNTTRRPSARGMKSTQAPIKGFALTPHSGAPIPTQERALRG